MKESTPFIGAVISTVAFVIGLIIMAVSGGVGTVGMLATIIMIVSIIGTCVGFAAAASSKNADIFDPNFWL